MDRTRGHKRLTWRTALSCEGGACVQVAVDDHSILIGNSRHPGGPVLEYTPNEWHEFVASIKKGDFDDLLKLHTAAACSDDALGGTVGLIRGGKLQPH